MLVAWLVTAFADAPITVGLLGLVSLALFIIPGLYHTWHDWKYPLPGPMPMGLIGTIYKIVPLMDRLHIYETAQLKQYCPEYNGMVKTWLFMKPIVAFINRNDIRDVFVKNYEDYDRSTLEQEILRDFLGDGLILASNGPAWHDQRKLLTPAFHHTNLKDFFGGELLNILKPHISNLETTDTKSKDVQSVMQSITFSAASRFVLGLNAYDVYPDSEKMWQRLLRASTWKLLGFVWHWKFISTPLSKQYDSDITNLRKLSNIAIDNALNAGDKLEERYDIVALLAKGHLDDPDKCSREQIVKQLFTFLFAGHDTTSNLLTWALYHLALDESIQKHAQEEVDRVMPGNEPMEYAQIAELKYIKAIAQESLRMYPSAPIRGRTVARSGVKNSTNVELAEGQVVVMNIHAIHHNPKTYPNPDKFDPSRFYGARQPGRTQYDYLPFGLGPRRCIGESLANMIAYVTLAQILKLYTITYDNSRPTCDELALTLRARDGMHLYFTRRS